MLDILIQENELVKVTKAKKKWIKSTQEAVTEQRRTEKKPSQSDEHANIITNLAWKPHLHMNGERECPIAQ